MVQDYGCGFIDVVDYTVYEALLPDTWADHNLDEHKLIAFPGTGMITAEIPKNKKAYTKTPVGQYPLDRDVYWFFAADELDPDVAIALVRAQFVSGTIYISIAELPYWGQGEEYPLPNQLTVDKDGVVYFPTGSILPYGTYPQIVRAEVTDEDPFEITYTVSTQETNEGATYGIALNKTHDLVCTYNSHQGDGDYILVFDTATLTGFKRFPVSDGEEGQLGGVVPANIETNIGIGEDTGYSYLFAGTTAQGFNMDTFNNGDDTVCTLNLGTVGEDSMEPVVISINNDGYITGDERKTRLDGEETLFFYLSYYMYDPANVSLGQLKFMGADMYYDLPVYPPTSHDWRREHPELFANNVVFISTGRGMTLGDIREMRDAVLFYPRHFQPEYRQLDVSCNREPWVNEDDAWVWFGETDSPAKWVAFSEAQHPVM